MANWTNIRKRLGNRTAVVVAGAVGFAIGAGGFAAAQHGGDDAAASATSVDVTVPDDTVTDTSPDTVADDTVADDTTPDDTTPDDTTPDDTAAPTSVDVTIPDVTIPDVTTPAVPDGGTPDGTTDVSVPTSVADSGPDVSTPDVSLPTTVDDDVTSTSIDDDDTTSSSVPAPSLPAPFSRTYDSSGGSIGVSWTGTALVLDSIGPAAGYTAEIEDQSWDRVRVDFEGDDDARIEIRVDDGEIRVRID